MKTGLAFLRLFGIRTYRSFRLTLRAVFLLAGLYAAFCVSVLLEQREWAAASQIFIIACVAAFMEFVLADVLADRSFPFDTERKLALMEKRLGADVIETISRRLKETIKEFRGCDILRVSGTVHLVAELTATADQRVREGLLQLTDYVGPHDGRKGRLTLINQGIIGRCARTGELEFVDFADAAEYYSAMVRDFGFTKKQADSHTKTARSYLAYPLASNGRVIGVLYFFTTEPQVFPLAAKEARLDAVAREIVNYLRLAQLA